MNNVPSPIQIDEITLGNGLRLCLMKVDGAKQINVNVNVLFGARDELDHQRGLAHMVEHLVVDQNLCAAPFNRIGLAFSAEGSHLRAETSASHTRYYFRCDVGNFSRLLKIVRCMLSNPCISESDLAREKRIIEREYADDFDLYSQCRRELRLSLGSKCAAHHSPLGDMETIRGTTLADVDAAIKTYYQPSNMVVVLAGNITQRVRNQTISILGGVVGQKHAPKISRRKYAKQGRNFIAIPRSQSEIRLIIAYPLIGEESPQNIVMFDLVHTILAHRVYGTLLRKHGLFYVWFYWIDRFPGSRIGYLEVQCERSEMDVAGRLLFEEIRGIVSKGVDVGLFAAITRGMARAPKHGEEYLEQLADQACLAQIAGQSCKWMSQYQSILNSISASDINSFARSVLNPKNLRIGSVGSADAKELAKAFGISHSLKRNPQPKSPVQEISDTSGWSPERIQARLTEVKAILGWARTKGSAAKWWTAFEEENKERLGLVLKFAEELAFRRATIAQFYLSYVYSDTDEDIQANLHFLDFQRRCKVLKRSIKKSAKPIPKRPLEKDLRRSLLLIRQQIRYEASHPMAKLWWTKIEHKWQRRIPVIEQIANELSAKHGNLNDLFWSAVRCRIHDPKAAFHYYMFHRLAGELRDRKVLKKLDADGDNILPGYAEQNHRLLEDRLLSERMRTFMAGIRAEGDEHKEQPSRSLDEFLSNWTFMLRHFDGIHITEDCPDALNLFLEDVGPIVADHLARDEPIDLIAIGEEVSRSMKYLIPSPEVPWKLLMRAVDRLGEGAKLTKIRQIASDLEFAYPDSINQYAPALLQRLQREKDKPGT